MQNTCRPVIERNHFSVLFGRARIRDLRRHFYLIESLQFLTINEPQQPQQQHGIRQRNNKIKEIPRNLFLSFSFVPFVLTRPKNPRKRFASQTLRHFNIDVKHTGFGRIQKKMSNGTTEKKKKNKRRSLTYAFARP